MSSARNIIKPAATSALASLLCHMVIVPVAAWNHNVPLVIIAALFPMIFMMVLRKTGKLPTVNVSGLQTAKSLAHLVVVTAVVTILCWNHLWLVALALAAVSVAVRTRFTKAVK